MSTTIVSKINSAPAIKKRLDKQCAICGKAIKAIVYKNHAYRGGHYFSKIPLHSKSEIARVLKAGTRPARIGGATLQILKKDPQPYSHSEYWECPACYWG